MPKDVGYCVPLCTKKSNNSSDVSFYRIPREKARQSNHLFNCFTVQSSGVFRGKVAPGISSCLRGFSFVPLTPNIT